MQKLTTPTLLAIQIYGEEHQKRKAIEELGELITALAREADGRSSSEEIITEIADVDIMLEQLKLIYGIDACLRERKRKLERLLKRITNGKGENTEAG